MTVQLSADLWRSFLPDTLSASIGTLIGAAVAAAIAYWIYRRELEHRRTERLNDALAKVIEAVSIEEAAFDDLIPTNSSFKPDRVDRIMRTKIRPERWNGIRSVRRTTRALLSAAKLTAVGEDITGLRGLITIHDALDSVTTPRAKIGLYDGILTATSNWREGQVTAGEVAKISEDVVAHARADDQDGLDPERPKIVF